MELDSNFIIGLSTFILALLGFLQFVMTTIKSSNEKITALADENRDLKNDIEDLQDEVDKWKKRAIAERKTRKQVGTMLTTCNERVRQAHRVFTEQKNKIAALEEGKNGGDENG